MSFLDELVQKGSLSDADARAIEAKAKESGETLEDVARAEGVAASTILEAKGMHYGLPTRTVDAKQISFDVLNAIPEESARHYSFVPIGMTDNALEVGIVDPDNIEAKDALQFITAKTRLPYKLYLITQKDFEDVLKNYH